jgi:chromosome segregation ATPase
MERKEPTLSGGTSLPERDDVITRKPSVDTSRPQRSPTPPVAKTAPSSGSNTLTLVALLLALVGVALGGFFGWKLTESQAVLQKAEARITDLEGRLSVTSDESSQSLTQVDAKLKWVDTEIRKLWGISNDVNRKAIAANKENIASLAKELAAAKKDAGEAKTTAASLGSRLDSNKAAVDDAVAKIESAVASIAEQGKRLQDFTEQVDRVEGQLGTIQTLEQKVRSSEEAIAAIDAYRRTINRDILELKQRLNAAPAN